MLISRDQPEVGKCPYHLRSTHLTFPIAVNGAGPARSTLLHHGMTLCRQITCMTLHAQWRLHSWHSQASITHNLGRPTVACSRGQGRRQLVVMVAVMMLMR